MSHTHAVSPSDLARSRGVTEILHFTTSRGLVGILNSNGVVCRDRLDSDQTLEAIRLPNAASRSKDAAWTGYVNLSVSRVNVSMLGYSKNWHRIDGVWWAIVAFDVSIVDDPGVTFTTTNNTYPVVQRAVGVAGFEAMFADRVPWGYYGSVAIRTASTPASYTTCPQAEVLYPDVVTLDRATNVYVPEPDYLDDVAGMMSAFPNAQGLQVTCAPAVFQ